MTRRTLLSVLGICAIGVVSIGYMQNAGLPPIIEDTKSAMFEVKDTNGLISGARVLLRGVEIGHVTQMKASAEAVTVNWEYDSSYEIPADSTFRVDNLSALGEPYILVSPSTDQSPYLPDDAVIPPDKVEVPTTFKEMSERLTRTLTQVDPEKVNRIFETLNVALPEDREVFESLARSGDLFASETTLQGDNLQALLDTMQPLLMDSGAIPEGLRSSAPNLQGMAQGLNNFLEGIRFAAEFGPLNSGIANGVSPMFGELQAFLDLSAADLQTLGLAVLPPVAEATATLRTADVSHLLDAALRDTSDGALTVHVGIPGK